MLTSVDFSGGCLRIEQATQRDSCKSVIDKATLKSCSGSGATVNPSRYQLFMDLVRPAMVDSVLVAERSLEPLLGE